MEVEDLGHHISRRFNEDLERVRNSVLSMGGLVEEQLDRAVKALSEGNSQLGLQVAEDDSKVNRMEVSIDEECSRILATRAPAALNPFARLDTKGALEVVKADNTVDEEYESIYRQGITFMMEDPRTITRNMDMTWMARSLERIGDHAKNICEYVIFMVHGKDVRHIGVKNIEAEVEQGVRRVEGTT